MCRAGKRTGHRRHYFISPEATTARNRRAGRKDHPVNRPGTRFKADSGPVPVILRKEQLYQKRHIYSAVTFTIFE